MKALLVILSALALSACASSTTPPPAVVICPQPPTHLLMRPEPLMPVTSGRLSPATTPAPERAKPSSPP